MKVNSISSTLSVYRANIQNKFSQNPIITTNNSENDIFVKAPNVSVVKPKQVNFMGYPVHIIDGGRHAVDLEHFAEAISKDMNIITHKVKKIVRKTSLVDVKSLYEQLKYINDNNVIGKDAYVAIPASVSVSLNNIREQFMDVMGGPVYLKPERVKSEKGRLIEFLKKLYDNPNKYRKNLDILDPEHQGLEYTYGVITEINKINCKNKYVPAEHAIYKTLKGMAEERNLKPELQHFIATGQDSYGHINNLRNEINSQGIYDFNLLGLSNAQVINLKGPNKGDYIYSGFDMSITDGERGVYNFSPVRENGKIVGYSFHDTTTKEYPFEEFPGNQEVSNIAKFVGLDGNEVIANDWEIAEFQKALRENQNLDRFANKIYPTHKVMSDTDRWNTKADIRGDFVDSTFQLFFRKNNEGKIIFPNCDCEGSGRPSVMSMWGSCFSIFNVIKRNIDFENLHKIYEADKINFAGLVESSISAGKLAETKGNVKEAIKRYEDAIRQLYIKGFDFRRSRDLEPYRALADLKFNIGDYDGAEPLYNKLVNWKSKYVQELRNRSALDYNGYQEIYVEIANMFDKLGKICDKKGEMYPAQWCRRAVETFKSNSFGIRDKLIARRADENLNIGDLFV